MLKGLRLKELHKFTIDNDNLRVKSEISQQS